MIIERIRNLLGSKGKSHTEVPLILSVEEQVNAWGSASRRMGWGIEKNEIEQIPQPPPLTDKDIKQGFSGVCIFYGFGDDGSGHAEAVMSGAVAWDYACKTRKKRAWQTPYVHFDRADSFRLRPEAMLRPKGFYFAKIQTGESLLRKTVSEARAFFDSLTGWGPEGFQFLCITHHHFADLMSLRKTPFMLLADYDVAPHGFNDFFDVPHLFCSNRILGLGVGNINQKYEGFGIPTLRLIDKG